MELLHPMQNMGVTLYELLKNFKLLPKYRIIREEVWWLI